MLAELRHITYFIKRTRPYVPAAAEPVRSRIASAGKFMQYLNHLRLGTGVGNLTVQPTDKYMRSHCRTTYRALQSSRIIGPLSVATRLLVITVQIVGRNGLWFSSSLPHLPD